MTTRSMSDRHEFISVDFVCVVHLNRSIVTYIINYTKVISNKNISYVRLSYFKSSIIER